VEGRSGCLPPPEALPDPSGEETEEETEAAADVEDDAGGDVVAGGDEAGGDDGGLTSGPCDGECDGVRLGDVEREGEGEWEWDGEWDGECDGEGEWECEGEWDGDGEPEPEGPEADVDGDADVDGEVEPLGHGLQEVLGSPPGRQLPGGGGTRWSSWPWPPAGRANQTRNRSSYSTTTFTWVTDSLTTTTFSGRNDAQAAPVKLCGMAEATGGRSGLPQAQRALGSPLPSISTAVPACNTAGKAVALPLLKP